VEGFDVNISPDKVRLPIFGGIDLSETVITAWIMMAAIIIAAVIVRIVVIRRFKTVPGGAQNVVEIMIDGVNKFSNSVLHDKGKTIAAYILTIAMFIFLSSLTELFGFRAPAADLNFTIGISSISFVLIYAYGFFYKGFLGRLKWFLKPKAFMLPINVVTQAVIPVSLSFRLFGNMFAGLIVMDLVYSAMHYFAVGIPALLSIYFNLFHVGIQTYIFVLLTLSFIREAVE